MPFLFWLPMIVMSGMWSVARDGDRKPVASELSDGAKPAPVSADQPTS